MFKNVVKSLGVIIAYFSAQVISIVVVLIYLSVYNLDWLYELDDIINTYGTISSEYFYKLSEILYPTLLISNILVIVPFIIFLVFKKKCPVFKISRKEFLLVFCLGISLNFIVSFIISLLSNFTVVNNYETSINSLLGNNFILSFILIGVFSPIVEEFIFRYSLINILKDKSIKNALIISSLIFGVSHMNIIQGIYAFLLGLVLGYLYIYKFNLMHSILFHIVVNSSSIIFEHISSKFIYLAYLFIFICILYCIIYAILNKDNIKCFKNNLVNSEVYK